MILFCVFMFMASACFADTVITDDLIPASPFLKGNRLLSITAGRSFDTRYGHISLLQVNINEYIIDNLAFHYGASFGYANTKNTQNGYCGGP